MVTVKNIYICDTCGAEYDTEQKAKNCEMIPSQCPLFGIGDKARVITGRGKGEIVTIKDFCYMESNNAPRQYAHKVIYDVKFNNGDTRYLIEGIDCERE